ncbi:hypothetical protein [uncultured Nostoc sp.]|uniref:hypothetical protein n=1 Tax=uncultured Nostoc sp. TaxID=340711 RepID=UPI00262D82A7|nr:hypothetical protein [uncultured Nostoc sp.]
MKPELWRTIKKEITVWRVGTLPGIAVIGLVMIAHLTGLMQSMDGNIYGFWLGVWLELPLLGSVNHL